MHDDTMHWTATFITSDRSHADEGQPAPYFRTEFEVSEGVIGARLAVTGIGVVEAHLNGSMVGDEVLCPGWTSYDHRLLVSEHDVTDQLRVGRNAIGAIAGEGWAVGRVGLARHRNRWGDRPAVFLQLEIRYTDRIETVSTDGAWRTSTGAVVADGIYDGEVYDARLEPMGWSEPGFDDNAWDAVAISARDTTTLERRTAPPVRAIEELPPVTITRTPDGTSLVDFGQVLTGFVRLRVDGPTGTTVTIRHTEFCANDVPDYEPNRGARATDTYVLRGGGPEQWQPRFTFHGFRYAEISGWPGTLSPESIRAVVIQSDMARTGWFECSDERVSQLHRNIVWSWRGNSVSLPTDCPQRDERLGWTGDINAFASTAAFLYDVRDFLGSWLDDVVAEQADDGGIPVVVPDVINSFSGFTALWGDVIVSLPWTLYQTYGDTGILRRTYDAMTRFIDAIDADLDERGLWSRGFQFGDWVDPDAPASRPSKGKAEETLVAMAYLARTTGELAQVAELLGHDAAAARYRAMHDRVVAAFRQEWVAPSGRLANECQTSYALAICFGLLDPDRERRAGERLAELVAAADYRISTGFAGTPWVAPALCRTGHQDVAFRMLTQTVPPSYLYPVTMGATTVWERWDAVLPDGTLHSTGMTSLNHYALGAIGDWLHRHIGGLSPLEPGYRRFAVAPHAGGGITWAHLRFESVHGFIDIRWEDRDLRRTLEVVVPDGTEATVHLVGHPDDAMEVVGPGIHRWSYELPAAAPLGLATPMDELREHPALWSALHELFSTLMDGVPDLFVYIADGAPSLDVAMPKLPGVTPEFETRLEQLFERYAAGEAAGAEKRAPR